MEELKLQTKRCPKCGYTKARSEFARSRNKKDGLDSWCKLCRSDSKRTTVGPTAIYTRVRNGQVQTVTRRVKAHGESRTPLYRQWVAMKRRCESPAAHNYRWYGGKGIRVCSEWRNDFLAFKAWADANGYVRGLELDRKDAGKDYCPENCQYVTKAQNLRNMRIAADGSLEAEIRRAAGSLRITTGELLDQAARHYLDYLQETGALAAR